MSPAGKQYVNAYNSTAESNIVDFPDELKFHSHEEADNLIVLHCIDIIKSNPFCQLYVACSSDIDVPLLLLYFYRQLCNNTVFDATTRDWHWMCVQCTGKGRKYGAVRFSCFYHLWLTRRFSGFSKTTCFDTPLKSIHSYIKHLLHWETMTMVWKKR